MPFSYTNFQQKSSDLIFFYWASSISIISSSDVLLLVVVQVLVLIIIFIQVFALVVDLVPRFHISFDRASGNAAWYSLCKFPKKHRVVSLILVLVLVLDLISVLILGLSITSAEASKGSEQKKHWRGKTIVHKQLQCFVSSEASDAPATMKYKFLVPALSEQVLKEHWVVPSS